VRRGHPADAVATFRRSLAIFEASLGKDHPYDAVPLRSLGEIFVAQGHPAEAVPLLERALAIRVAAKLPPAALGEARFSLAKALAADPRQRARARELATAALGELDKDDAAEVSAWLRAH
jgi:tetratricopeptide (TPR) repeat protein